MSHETGTLPAEGVRAMFDRIAPVYDAMNRVMTAGLDQRWRRLTAGSVVSPGDRVLDACCGTGDLAVAARAAGAGEVVGLDFSERMLERARRKDPSVEWVQGATSPTSSAGSQSCGACSARAAASACSRSRARAGRCACSSASGSTC